MTYTIAIHGALSNGNMLRQDIGKPSWIDHYPTYKHVKHYDQIRELIIECESVNLIGYSKGGSLIADLTNDEDILPRIKSAVLYESPVFNVAQCRGTFPVLMIWNNRGYITHPRRRLLALQSIALWQQTHTITFLLGNGPHFYLNPPRHGWDRELNPIIEQWLTVINQAQQYITHINQPD